MSEWENNSCNFKDSLHWWILFLTSMTCWNRSEYTVRETVLTLNLVRAWIRTSSHQGNPSSQVFSWTSSGSVRFGLSAGFGPLPTPVSLWGKPVSLVFLLWVQRQSMNMMSLLGCLKNSCFTGLFLCKYLKHVPNVCASTRLWALWKKIEQYYVYVFGTSNCC